MLTFVLRRFIEALLVLFLIVTATFFMVRLVPGGPFDGEKELPEVTRQQLESYYGLDKPLPVQYARYLGNLLRGDLGTTFKYQGWTVNEIIARKLPVSFELGALAMGIALVLGIGSGVLAAWRPRTATDTLPMSLAMLGICLPTFVLGPMLILVFGLKLHLVNVMGWNLPQDRILPALTLGLFYAAYIARLTRSSMLEIRGEDYMRTARAKGLSEARVYLLHGLRNGLSPVVSYLGPALAGLISGSFVVETIFNIPGLGRFFVQAALDNDYFMVLGCVLFYAALIILFNLISDILLVWLNPRRKLA
ncbi:ABC transporter permease [Ruficoccus amylovorans]|uniref:ABC transporter permease n=1 Tax=Ruficoccus amylovorans TaxID=1804625 RepID=A0A842HGQ9_9BACT|nr:ABC transporter permease [Ruficoccus amylovorans]MBC2594806.1 ABC transporter permease [Ruficoccus amylovorans]